MLFVDYSTSVYANGGSLTLRHRSSCDASTPRGVLRTYETPRHYWIEDENLNRVALQPEDKLPPLVGRKLRVVGKFSYSPTKGRIITIEQMELEL